MARTSLFDVLSVADPAQSWNFDLFLPAIPGSSDTRDLTYKCMTMDLPGSGLDKVPVALHGVELEYAGRQIYTHSSSCTFLEASDWSTRNKFVAWRESARSWVNNSGSFASFYKVNAQMVVYNDLPAVARTINVYGLWPETIGEVALDGSQSGLVQLTITFAYDYTIDQ